MQIYKNTGEYCKLRPKKLWIFLKEGHFISTCSSFKKKKQKEEMNKLTASHAGTCL